MNPRWFARPDWPQPHEEELRASLLAAIRSLQGAALLDDDDAEGRALLLFAASHAGRAELSPRNSAASHEATEKELRRLHKLAGDLAEHIETMRRPTVGALFAEGGADLFALAVRLRDLQDETRAAFGEAPGDGGGKGAPSKAEAAAITEMAASIYQRTAGKRPTFTRDPVTGEARGAWIDFLASVFEALGVGASPEAQSRALREEKAARSAR